MKNPLNSLKLLKSVENSAKFFSEDPRYLVPYDDKPYMVVDRKWSYLPNLNEEVAHVPKKKKKGVKPFKYDIIGDDRFEYDSAKRI
jgi:hypothetical protein